MSALIFLSIWLTLTMALATLATRQLWGSLEHARRFYLLASWSLVSFGTIQILFSPFKFKPFDETALWFATAGFGVLLTGALNLLNVGRRLEDGALRRTCFGANVTITLVFVAVATHRGAEPPHDPVSISLMTVAMFATAVSGGFQPSRRGKFPRG